MLRSYLYVSLFLSVILIVGGCAKKTVPEVPAPPAPAVTQPSENLSVDVEPVAPASVETLIKLEDKKLETVLFEFDSYALTPVAKQLLKDTAEWLVNNLEGKVALEGHCDERGSDEYNLALGERRALATKNYLIELGVASEQMTIISYGEERPVSSGSNEMAWRQNRRVEFN